MRPGFLVALLLVVGCSSSPSGVTTTRQPGATCGYWSGSPQPNDIECGDGMSCVTQADGVGPLHQVGICTQPDAGLCFGGGACPNGWTCDQAGTYSVPSNPHCLVKCSSQADCPWAYQVCDLAEHACRIISCPDPRVLDGFSGDPNSYCPTGSHCQFCPKSESCNRGICVKD